MKLASIFILLLLNASEPIEGWELFSRIPFKLKYFKEEGAHCAMPELDAKMRSYEGREVILEGYYMPFDLPNKDAFVISQNPYSSCFFCGGAGPESVAEVVMKSRPKFRGDQIITVIGRLKFNDSDLDRLNFIIEDPEVTTD